MQTEKKILDQVSILTQTKGYTYKTQQLYLKWVKAYLRFNKEQDIKNLGIIEIEHFKNYLSHSRMFSYEIKKQATQAIFFLYTQVLGINLQNQYIQSARNIKPPKREKKQKMVQSVMVF